MNPEFEELAKKMGWTIVQPAKVSEKEDVQAEPVIKPKEELEKRAKPPEPIVYFCGRPKAPERVFTSGDLCGGAKAGTYHSPWGDTAEMTEQMYQGTYNLNLI